MSAKTILEEEGGSHQKTLTRYELVQELERQGFTVHAVVTPIDPVFGKKPGLAYETLLKPQYERRIKDPRVNRNKMQADAFLEDSNYKITRLKWDYYLFQMEFINNVIKGNLDSGGFSYLNGNIQQLRGKLAELKKLAPTNSEYIQIDSVLEEAENHLRQVEQLSKSDMSKAIEYILEIDWVKKLPWLTKLKIQEHAARDPWDKGSMYAFVSSSEMMQQEFNPDGFVFFDDKQVCLDTVSNLHPELDLHQSMTCVKVDPKFKDTKEYFEDKLSALMPKASERMATRRQLNAIETEFKKQGGLNHSSYLNHFLFYFSSYDDKTKTDLKLMRALFLDELEKYIKLLPTDEKRLEAYKQYRESPVLHTHRKSWFKAIGRTDAIIEIDSKIDALKETIKTNRSSVSKTH